MGRKLMTMTVAGALLLGGGAAGAATLAGPAVAAAADQAGEASTSRAERIAAALSGLVDAGTITQAQAEEVAETLAEQLPGRGHGGPGGEIRGRGLPGGLVMDLDTAAEVVGLSEEELRAALAEDGATLASVAQGQGVATEDLVDALVAAAERHLDEEVAEGGLTQEEADERVDGLRERVQAAVEQELPARGRPEG
ncbi:hypothetical protein [Pseudokineococcus sp. 1T1Z-3]|uniref:hypothetical protein n=1 Tax=Pseudokineococcus sp. 1T1Z-3 TaxID=3132745 RepID=UPI0030B3098D